MVEHDEQDHEAQTGESVDVFYVIDRLEDLVGEATRLPLSGGRVMVDPHLFADLCEQLRITLPDELRQAQRVIREREKIIADAQSDASHVLEAAQKRVDYMMSEKGLLNEARVRSEEILSKADRQRLEGLAEIDIYAMEQFQKMEDALREGLQIIDEAVQEVVQSLQRAKDEVGR